MANLDGILIPSRFLTLLSHLIITTTIFLSRGQNIQACLPLEYTFHDFERKDLQLKIGLSLTLALIFYELIGFLSGISMFKYKTSLISFFGHACASIALSLFVLYEWDCEIFWWIFVPCSFLPALFETLTMVSVLIFKMK